MSTINYVNIIRNISHYTCSAITSSSNEYGVQNGLVSLEPANAFQSIPTDCITGYQYTINWTIIGTVSNPLFKLDYSFSDIQSCAANTLTIRPIVRVDSSILNNVVVTGHTCDRGNYKLTLAIEFMLCFPK